MRSETPRLCLSSCRNGAMCPHLGAKAHSGQSSPTVLLCEWTQPLFLSPRVLACIFGARLRQLFPPTAQAQGLSHRVEGKAPANCDGRDSHRSKMEESIRQTSLSAYFPDGSSGRPPSIWNRAKSHNRNWNLTLPTPS